MPAELTTTLWLRYMLAAAHASRSCPRHILPYDVLLRDSRGSLMRAGHAAAIAWPVAFDSIAPLMAALLRSQLRHHLAYMSAEQTVGGPLGRWADEVYQALLALAAELSKVGQLQRLDSVRGGFRDWCNEHGRAWSATLLAGYAIHARHPPFEIPAAWDDAASRHAQSAPGVTQPGDNNEA